MERHRSQVHLVSEVGIGTTFWFDLDVFNEQPGLVTVDAANSQLPTA